MSGARTTARWLKLLNVLAVAFSAENAPMFHVKHFSYGPEDFLRDTDVSRETLARLEAYAALLTTWNKTTNLVGPATIPDLWFRHMLDSAQLYPLTQDSPSLVDLGSGAGFPGLVLAILGQ